MTRIFIRLGSILFLLMFSGVVQAQKSGGCGDAYDAFYKKHADKLHGEAVALVTDKNLADEIVAGRAKIGSKVYFFDEYGAKRKGILLYDNEGKAFIQSSSGTLRPVLTAEEALAEGKNSVRPVAIEPPVPEVPRSGPMDTAAVIQENQKIFQNSPIAKPELANYSVIELPDGKGQAIFVASVRDRSYGLEKGLIFENVPASQLPRGKNYTFVITEDGKTAYGLVENGLEYGTKHVALANGKRVLAAGEIHVDELGRYTYNIESGTYYKALTGGDPVKNEELARKAGQAFKNDFGIEGKFVKNRLLPEETYTMEDFRKLCKSAGFLARNKKICSQLGLR